MHLEQVFRIFETVNHDRRIDDIIELYRVRKLGATSSQLTLHDLRTPIMWALEDFLKRGGKPEAARYRDEADILDRAVAILADNEMHHFRAFSCFMAHNRQGGSGDTQAKQALSAMQTVADGLRGFAETYGKAEINNTFFYCLGRRFKQSNLPRPSASLAYELFKIVTEAMEAESPDLLDGITTDYDPNGERGSQIRRLLQAGYK